MSRLRLTPTPDDVGDIRVRLEGLNPGRKYVVLPNARRST